MSSVMKNGFEKLHINSGVTQPIAEISIWFLTNSDAYLIFWSYKMKAILILCVVIAAAVSTDVYKSSKSIKKCVKVSHIQWIMS